MDFITALKGGTGLGSSFADTLIKTSNFTPKLASSSGGFLKWIKKILLVISEIGYLKSSDTNKITNFDRLGNVLGGAGALYGAYNQQKNGTKEFWPQKRCL